MIKFIPKRIVPTVKVMVVGIVNLGPLVNGKTTGGAMKVNRIKIRISGFGILFSTLACIPNWLSAKMVIV